MNGSPARFARTCCVLLGAIPAAGSAADWLQFGYDAAHSGNNTAETTLNAANVHLLTLLYSKEIPTESSASAVFLEGVVLPDRVRDLLFVTGTDGTLMALEADTGTLVWSRKPTPAGDIWQGESVTPAIDPSREYVYSTGLDGKVHKYAVASGDETVNGHWPFVSTLKPLVEHSAAALAIATSNYTSYLYAVTNGFNGDGGDYQGHVTAIDLNASTYKVFNANCSKLTLHFIENGTANFNDCATPRSGIWGRPGTVFDASTNRIYVTTANGNYNANVGGYNWGDSVLALNADGSGSGMGNPVDSYTPESYYELDLYDIDLGSGAVAIVPAPATSKYPHLGTVLGKDGILRLLNLDDMSGQHGPRFVGGELQTVRAGYVVDIATQQAAAWVDANGDGSTWLYSAVSNELTAMQLKIGAGGEPTLEVQWSRYGSDYSPSPVLAGDVLYFESMTRALDPRTGNELWSAPPGTYCNGYGQPVVVNGRLYVLGGKTLSVFALPNEIFVDGFDAAQ